LTLTADGAALVARAGETIQDQLLTGFSTLDPVTQQRLAESLEAWVAGSGLAGNAAPFFFEAAAGPKRRSQVKQRELPPKALD
jgi:hypothetical protein